MADIAELGLKINSQPVDQAGAKLKNFGKIASDTERKVLQSTNGMATGFKSFNKNMATTEPAIKRVETNLKNFKLVSERSLFPKGGAALTAIKDFRAELERVPSGTGQAVTAISSIEKTAKTATATSGNFSNSIRQISLQLSQVAQQGAVTGDFFRAFTVQLPDLLLGFGTFGILIGAVAGALGGPLIDALSGTSKEARQLDNDINELIGSLESSERQANETILARLEEQAQAATSEIESLRDVTKDLSGRQLRAISAGEETRIARIKEIAEELLELDTRSATTNRARNALSTQRRRLDSELADLKGVDESRSARILELEEKRAQILTAQAKVRSRMKEDELESSLPQSDARDKQLADRLEEFDQVRNAILDQNKTETQLAIEGAAARNSALAAAYSDDLIAFNEYKALRAENQLALQAELTEIDEKGAAQRGQLLTNEQQSTLGASAQFFGNLASIAQAGGEEQFQEYKNLASAQAAISAALAVTSVLGDPLLPTFAKAPLAVSIGALAAVQIAQIQGQEYQSSRASGGQAKGRVLVGENGPEILNMGNSTGSITSAADTKKEMQGQTVQQIFNISPGLSGAIQAEIERAIPLMAKVAVSSVSGDIRRGGSTAKAVGIR